MHSLQIMTYTFPWWASLLIMLFIAYLAIFGNIDPDFYYPIHYMPMRILGGCVLFVIIGFIMPRVRFKMFGPISDWIGILPSGKEFGIFLAIAGVVLSVITWGIYAVVRPREQRVKSLPDAKSSPDEQK